MSAAKIPASPTHTTVQPRASRKLTACLSRRNTPRSSGSIASTKTLKMTQKIQLECIRPFRNCHSIRRGEIVGEELLRALVPGHDFRHAEPCAFFRVILSGADAQLR